MLPDAYDRLTKLIYVGAFDDNALVETLQALAEHYCCRSAAFVYADRDLPKTDFAFTFGPFSRPEVRSRYLSDFANLDPAPRAMAGMPLGMASATNRLFTSEYMDNSRFVNEFYRPLGLEEALGGPVINAEGRTGLVAIHRGRDRDAFDDREIAEFGRLLPHFGQALTMRRMFFAEMEGRQALAEALEPASQAVILLSPQCEVLHANLKARSLFARQDGLSLTHSGHFEIDDKEAHRRFALGISSLLKPVLLKAPRSKDRPPYAVRLCPSGNALDAAAWTGAVLYIFDPDHRSGDPETTLQAVFGLSRQAAKLVATLLAGGDLAAYAELVNVSKNTAKFHLMSAFAATGTRRQSDLVRIVTGLLRDLGSDAVDRSITSPETRKLLSRQALE